VVSSHSGLILTSFETDYKYSLSKEQAESMNQNKKSNSHTPELKKQVENNEEKP